MKSVMSSRSLVFPSIASSALAGLAVRLGREIHRFLQPEQGHVGELAVPLIGALWLSELGVRTGHVEDVVDDLEEDPELLGEAAVGRGFVVGNAGEMERHEDACGDEPARLQAVKLAQALGVLDARGDVDVLAADHAADAGRRRQASEAPRPRSRARPPARRGRG